MTKKILIAILPVLTGCYIYITYRADTLILFHLFDTVGLDRFVSFIRLNAPLQTVPLWVKYSLPDALWIFSFIYTMLLLWKFKITKQSAFWILIAPAIGLCYEIAQLVIIIPGTFDIVDLLLTLCAILLAFYKPLKIILIKKINTMKSKKFLHLVSGAVVLAFVFFAVASSDDKSTEKEISETDLASAIHISASTLYEDYDANEISADQKYKGKVLVITGRIESIGKDITDNIYVALEGDGFINVVQCMFSDDHVSETSELRKGQSVKIKGRCSGQTLGSIIVRGCSLQ